MNINQAYEKWVVDDDEEALGILHSQLLGMAKSIILRMANDLHDLCLPYDLTTAVIMDARESHPVAASFSTWAYKAMLHDLFNHIRNSSAAKRAGVVLPIEDVEVVDTGRVLDDVEFDKRLNTLSDKDKRIAAMLIEGYTANAIAAEFGLDHTAIDRRLPVIAYKLWGDTNGTSSSDA